MPFSRQDQLNSASESLQSHLDLRTTIDEAMRRHSEQTSQLTGLYEEVDKLTKGRSILPTTDLFVALTNNLVSDAKTLVFRDTYLDRVTEFVPAGDNPSFPDILVTLRVVQQSLKRFETMLKSESTKHASAVLELRIIKSALQLAKIEEEGTSEDESEDEEAESEDDPEVEDEAEDDEAEESDEDPEEYEVYVSKFAVKKRLGMEINPLESLLGNEERKPYDRWFQRLQDTDYFNFARLDRLGLPAYEPPLAGITYERAEK